MFFAGDIRGSRDDTGANKEFERRTRDEEQKEKNETIVYSAVLAAATEVAQESRLESESIPTIQVEVKDIKDIKEKKNRLTSRIPSKKGYRTM